MTSSWSAEADDPFSGSGRRTSSSRFGQLTYTSVDGRGAGGWQVTDVHELTEAEQELLRSWIDPQLDTGDELPRFPAPDEVARLPRRLVFGPVPAPGQPPPTPPRTSSPPPENAVAWWHHAPAGADGSGRPGNVFTHVLVDREPRRTGPSAIGTRPVDWWRSAEWLTPFGPAAVRDAKLSPEPPGPAAAAGPAAVAAFLLDPAHYRLGVLAALLDACAGALAGGRPVALATRSTDSAACWIAAVSYLMAGSTARHLSFSTLERGSSLVTRREQGVLLCCLPMADHPALLEQKSDEFVLLHEEEDVSLGDLDGEPHVTAGGDRVPVTEWSVMARVALVDEPTVLQVLAAIDGLATRVALEQEVDGLVEEPGWPLALVVAHHQGDLADASDEAVRVLLRRGVDGLRRDDALRAAVQELVGRAAGTTTEAVWARLQPLARSGFALTEAAEPLLERYVVCAVRDPDWLARPDGAPVPTRAGLLGWRPSTACLAAIDGAIAGLGERSRSQVSAMADLMRLAEFLARLGLLRAEVADAMATALERAVVPALFAEEPADIPPESSLVQQLGVVSEPVLELVRPLVNGKLNEIRLSGDRYLLGRFLAPDILAWLYPSPPEQVWLDQISLDDDVRLRAEIARSLVLRDPVVFAHERALPVLTALLEAWSDADLAPLLAGPSWTLAELMPLERRCPGGLPLRVFVPAFAAEPDGPSLGEDAMTVLGNRFMARRIVDDGDEAVLRMRQRSQRRWWQGHNLRADLGDLLRGGLRTLDDPEVVLHEDAVDHLQAAMVLAVVTDERQEEVRPLLTMARMATAVTRPRVATMVTEGFRVAAPLEEVALVAVIGDPAFPHPVASPAERWAARVRSAHDGAPVPLLQRYVQERLADGSRNDDVVRRIDTRLQEVLQRSGVPERTARAATRFLQSWLRSLSPRDSLLHRLRNNP